MAQSLADAGGIGSSIRLTWTAVLSVGGSPNHAVNNSPVSSSTRVDLLNGTPPTRSIRRTRIRPARLRILLPINCTEAGTTLSGTNFVWSGGNANGVESARYDNWDNMGGISSSLGIYAVSNALTFSAVNTSVPEPATFGMAGITVAALGLFRRIRK